MKKFSSINSQRLLVITKFSSGRINDKEYSDFLMNLRAVSWLQRFCFVLVRRSAVCEDDDDGKPRLTTFSSRRTDLTLCFWFCFWPVRFRLGLFFDRCAFAHNIGSFVLKTVASVTADTLAVYDCGFEEPNIVRPTGESYVVDVQDVLRFHYGVDDYRAPVNVGDIVVVRQELFAGCFVFVPAVVQQFLTDAGVECLLCDSLENETVQRSWQDFVVLANGNVFC